MTAAHWRASIAAVGDGGLRWIIISSDGGLKQLMATNGQPHINPTCYTPMKHTNFAETHNAPPECAA